MAREGGPGVAVEAPALAPLAALALHGEHVREGLFQARGGGGARLPRAEAAAAQRARQVRTRAEVARFWRLLDNLPAAQVGRLAGLAVGLGGRGEGGTPALQLGRPHRESDENGAA